LTGYPEVHAPKVFRQFSCVVLWVNRCQAYEIVLPTTLPSSSTTLRHRWQIEFVNLSAGNNKSLETPRDAVSVADSDGDDDGDDDDDAVAIAISVRSTDCGPRTSREVDARMRIGGGGLPVGTTL